MPLISDLVLQARRILGDISKDRWSDERMLDIVNHGLRDINKFSGTYRSDYYFELMHYQTRYPLPSDLLSITSIWHNKQIVHMHNREHVTKKLFVTKDQLNRGILEIANPPVYVQRNKRFVAGPTDLSGTGENLTLSLWTDNTWTGLGTWTSTTLWGQDSGQVFDVPIDPLDGVAVNPVDTPFGVTTDLTIPFDIFTEQPATPYGILTAIYQSDTSIVPLQVGGDKFGVVTSVNIATVPASTQSGEIGYVNRPFRLVGSYGIVSSVLKPEEYIRVMYKSLPPRAYTLDTSFPLSPSWESPMINWIVGSALQDDNDANNLQRSTLFINRYVRELEEEQAESAKDYSSASKKYITKYTGGITNG